VCGGGYDDLGLLFGCLGVGTMMSYTSLGVLEVERGGATKSKGRQHKRKGKWSQAGTHYGNKS